MDPGRFPVYRRTTVQTRPALQIGYPVPQNQQFFDQTPRNPQDHPLFSVTAESKTIPFQGWSLICRLSSVD